MIEWTLLPACAAAMFATMLVSGIFLGFSDFIMRSLMDAEKPAGMECMQRINRYVFRSIFMVLFLGMVPFSILLPIVTFFSSTPAVFVWTLCASLLYVVGVFLLTGVCNVPMNQRLDSMDRTTQEAQDYWVEYGTAWTRWNHVRTVASFLSAVGYFIACLNLVGN